MIHISNDLIILCHTWKFWFLNINFDAWLSFVKYDAFPLFQVTLLLASSDPFKINTWHFDRHWITQMIIAQEIRADKLTLFLMYLSAFVKIEQVL